MANVFIVIPVLNEEKHIFEIIRSCQKEGYKNIIVVDDGSTDKTAEKGKEAGAIVISHIVNCGPGAATQTGIDVALDYGADIIVTLDGDGQHDPRDIHKLVLPITKNDKDVVIGSRFLDKNTIPWIRRLFNKFGNFVTYIISGKKVTDSQSGFKAFSRYAALILHIDNNGYEFCSELIRQIAEYKFNSAEVPIRVYYSQYSLNKGQSFANGVKITLKLIVRTLFG